MTTPAKTIEADLRLATLSTFQSYLRGSNLFTCTFNMWQNCVKDETPCRRRNTKYLEVCFIKPQKFSVFSIFFLFVFSSTGCHRSSIVILTSAFGELLFRNMPPTLFPVVFTPIGGISLNP